MNNDFYKSRISVGLSINFGIRYVRQVNRILLLGQLFCNSAEFSTEHTFTKNEIIKALIHLP